MIHAFFAIRTLWWREIIRFLRQRSRVFGAFSQPLVFWLLIGGGLNSSFHVPIEGGKIEYLEYFFPGTLALVLLFTAIFATISVVVDRQEGFLQGVLASPAPRWAIVAGQSLGGTSLAVLQAMLVLPFAPLAGIHLSVLSVLAFTGAAALVGFGLTNLGLLIAWRMDSTQGFHAVMNLILLPIWFLSGALFPAEGAPVWLGWLMAANPLTYGVAVMRRCLYMSSGHSGGNVPGMIPSLVVTGAFCVLSLAAAEWMAKRARA